MSKQYETSIPARMLGEIITGLRKIVPRRSDTLRDLKLDLDRGTLTGTDGSAYLSYQLGRPTPGGYDGNDSKAESHQGRTYLLSLDGLIHFAKGLPARQEIILKAGDERATLHSVARQCRAPRMTNSDPIGEPPRFPGRTSLISPGDRTAILRALSCASTDETRHILRGAFFAYEGATPQVVGTDGRCLYAEALQSLELNRSFVLPASPLLGWKGFAHDWHLKVSQSRKDPVMLRLTAGPWVFTTPAVEGNYPNWQQVVPDLSTRPNRITLGPDDLAALREINGEACAFLCRDGRVAFASQQKDNGQWRLLESRDSRCKGPGCRVALDPKFLRRALEVEPGEVCLGEETDPLIFRGKGRLVVMPLRISGPDFLDLPPKPNPNPPPKPAPVPSKTMQKNKPNPSDIPPAEHALETLKTLKGQLRESIGLVDQTLRHLREAQANQRATQKDIKTIRGTLQSLRKVAFDN
jgi:hypothetical protein